MRIIVQQNKLNDMKIIHLKNNEKKVVGESDFLDFLDGEENNYKIYIECNWSGEYNENTYFEINVTGKDYNESYIVTNPEFNFILNLLEVCHVVIIESKGDIDQEFIDDIIKIIDGLNDQMTSFDVLDQINYSMLKVTVKFVKKLAHRIIVIIHNFLDCNESLKSDIIKKSGKLIDRVYEINNVIRIIDNAYKLAEEICAKNIEDRKNDKIDILIDNIKEELVCFSEDRLYK